jgi:nucleotide-binding universal stress UspA family protein
MFAHILVAISEAEDTPETMTTVAAMAKAFSSKVTLFHARERLVGPYELEEQETIPQSRDYGEKMAAHLAAEGIPTGVVVEDARPDRLADHILAHADAEAVDLIIIGAHHPHNMRESLFGDIGKTLAHRAHCPVLLMPSVEPALPEHSTQPAHKRYRRA